MALNFSPDDYVSTVDAVKFGIDILYKGGARTTTFDFLADFDHNTVWGVLPDVAVNTVCNMALCHPGWLLYWVSDPDNHEFFEPFFGGVGGFTDEVFGELARVLSVSPVRSIDDVAGVVLFNRVNVGEDIFSAFSAWLNGFLPRGGLTVFQELESLLYRGIFYRSVLDVYGDNLNRVSFDDVDWLFVLDVDELRGDVSMDLWYGRFEHFLGELGVFPLGGVSG